MKKIVFLLFATASLSAAPRAVVFDFGDVLAHPNREIMREFLFDTFHLSPDEMKKVAQERDIAMKKGISETDFWIQFAKEKNITLSEVWPHAYQSTLKKALGVNLAMFTLIDELKSKGVRVGLLSNIEERPAKMVRSFGLYQSFDPCLLSFEIGIEKPDPKAYKILVEKMNLSPHDIVFIDDLPENVQAAKEMGIDAILFESEKQIRKELNTRGLLPNI